MEFYCTAGRGTQLFVTMELRHTFSEGIEINSTDGKIYFKTNYTGNDLYQKLMSLRSVERIFVQCIHEHFDNLDRRGLLTLLHTKLNNVNLWENCTRTLHKLEHLADRNVDSPVDDYEPVRKKHKWKDKAVTFRISCRLSGYPRKQLDIKKTSKQMGVLISKLLDWKIDLRSPKYEVNIHLSDATLIVGIPICNRPLSIRSYIKHCGLRTPVAWIMVELLDIQSGDIVLDPMCGCATILLEAAHSHHTSFYIGVDKDLSQLKLASENVDYAGQHDCRISLIHCDTKNLTLHNHSVNHIVTDAPFGQNHIVTGDIRQFYLDTLVEMCRILQPGGRIVILTSCSVCDFLKKIIPFSSGFCHHNNSDLKNNEVVCVPECVCLDSANQSSCYEVNKSGQPIDMSILPSCSKKLAVLELNDVYNVKLGETDGCICVLCKVTKINEKS